jgi:nicotinamidase-related amidase
VTVSSQVRGSLASLVAPESTTVLVQELQRGVVGAGSALEALAAAASEVGVVEHAVRVVVAARRAGVSIVHCTAETLHDGFGTNTNARLFTAARTLGMHNRPGSEAVSPLAELGPEAGDHVLPRYHGLSPLHGSSLDQLLRNEGVTTVVVLGVSLNIAIPNLVFDAVNFGYQVVVVSDAVVGVPIEFGQAVLDHSLSLVATLATSEELERAWPTPSGLPGE